MCVGGPALGVVSLLAAPSVLGLCSLLAGAVLGLVLLAVVAARTSPHDEATAGPVVLAWAAVLVLVVAAGISAVRWPPPSLLIVVPAAVECLLVGWPRLITRAPASVAPAGPVERYGQPVGRLFRVSALLLVAGTLALACGSVGLGMSWPLRIAVVLVPAAAAVVVLSVTRPLSHPTVTWRLMLASIGLGWALPLIGGASVPTLLSIPARLLASGLLMALLWPLACGALRRDRSRWLPGDDPVRRSARLYLVAAAVMLAVHIPSVLSAGLGGLSASDFLVPYVVLAVAMAGQLAGPPVAIPSPALCTERVGLRLPTHDDAAVLRDWLDDSDAVRAFGTKPSLPTMVTRINHDERDRRAGRSITFVITDALAPDQRLGLVKLTVDHRAVAEVSLVVAPAARGRRLGSEATALALGWAFGALGLRCARARIHRRNTRAQAAAARVGFHRRRCPALDGVWFVMRADELRSLAGPPDEGARQVMPLSAVAHAAGKRGGVHEASRRPPRG